MREEIQKNGDKVSLRDYCDIRFDEINKTIDLMHDASDVAIKLAANDLKTRLDSMNEFRSALKDQAGTFISRNEMDLKFETIEKNRKDNIALIISLVAVIVSVIFFFWKR